MSTSKVKNQCVLDLTRHIGGDQVTVNHKQLSQTNIVNTVLKSFTGATTIVTSF